jgi:hypothetical protein
MRTVDTDLVLALYHCKYSPLPCATLHGIQTTQEFYVYYLSQRTAVVRTGFEPVLAPSLTDGFSTKPLYAT